MFQVEIDIILSRLDVLLFLKGNIGFQHPILERFLMFLQINRRAGTLQLADLFDLAIHHRGKGVVRIFLDKLMVSSQRRRVILLMEILFRFRIQRSGGSRLIHGKIGHPQGNQHQYRQQPDDHALVAFPGGGGVIIIVL